MKTKIYTDGNYFFIDKGGVISSDLKSNVIITPLSADPAVYVIQSTLISRTEVALADLTDASDDPYDLSTWEAFYRSNTGFNFAANGSVTGWALYNDTQYTSASPFTILDGVTANLPNNGGVKNETQKPSDIADFYDTATGKITGRNGDGLLVTLIMKVRPTGPSAGARIRVAIDIGGSFGELFSRDFNLTKGSGVIHSYINSFGCFTGSTWEENGGQVKIEAINEDVEVYDIQYVLTRTHKAL